MGGQKAYWAALNGGPRTLIEKNYPVIRKTQVGGTLRLKALSHTGDPIQGFIVKSRYSYSVTILCALEVFS